MYALAFEVLVEELVQLFLLNWGQRVDFGAELWASGMEFDGMFHCFQFVVHQKTP